MRQLHGRHKPVINCFPMSRYTVEETTTQTAKKRNPSAISSGREEGTATVARTLVILAAVTGLSGTIAGRVPTEELPLTCATAANQAALITLAASPN